MSYKGTYTLHSFSGPWTPATRAYPALRWLEAYTNNVMSLGFASPYHDWYAPDGVYINGDGKIVRGGEAIWRWAGEDIFGTFSGISVQHDKTRVRLIESAGEAYYDDDEVRGVAPMDADVITYEHLIEFEFKDERLRNGGKVVVRRMMEWIVGKGQDGKGEEGLQCWQGKVCWDTDVLKKEVRRRMESFATTEEKKKGGLD